MKTIYHDGKELAINDAFQVALELLATNSYEEMTALCKKIIAVEPLHHRAMHGVGLGLHKLLQSDEAIAFIRRALEIDPEYFSAYNNLGSILRDMGRLDEALEAFQKGRSLQPQNAMIHNNIGGIFKDLGKTEAALESFQESLRIDPEYADAMYGLALCLHKLDKKTEALAAYRAFLLKMPEHYNALYALATVLKELSQPKVAHETFLQALALNPDSYDVHLAIANLLSEQVNFGKDWARDETLYHYERAAEIKPEVCENHITIGNILLERGRIDEALDSFRKAIELKPDNQIARSCLLMSSQYHPTPSLKEFYEESILWPKFCTAGIPRTHTHHNSPDPDRPLKIGYVSADLRMHPVGFYLLPPLYCHDGNRYQIFCYANGKDSDYFTDRLKGYSDHWRQVDKYSDEELYNQIVSDGIDILIDLSGHTSGNRLRVFARKPAPVQATWIGYFFSTGLPDIDYIFMDDTAVLPDEDCFFSENVIRLPQTRFCYEPPSFAPAVAPLPSLNNGYITFGSFNNLAKVTAPVINLWARVLSNVPGSKLLLKSASLGSDAVRQEIAAAFGEHGIDSDRLLLRGVSPHVEMLGEYADMDIALDPFPFNGGLTSCEALWMGVPVITLEGTRPISRQSLGFLKTIDLAGFNAVDESEYIDIAKGWSCNLAGLLEVRNSLREKMRSSLLCDGKKFTVNLETVFRTIWKEWCDSHAHK